MTSRCNKRSAQQMGLFLQERPLCRTVLSFSAYCLLLPNPAARPPVPDYEEYIKRVLYLFPRVLCQQPLLLQSAA